jgi:Family of unknown function (DUF5706)
MTFKGRRKHGHKSERKKFLRYTAVVRPSPSVLLVLRNIQQKGLGLAMNVDRLTQASREELNLVLAFFPRVESKSSVLLAIDTSMLGFLAAKAPPIGEWSLPMDISAGVSFALLAWSIAMLYHGAFPRLEGGQGSLIYFREIAGRTEHRFVEEFRGQSDEQYTNDLLGQTWRNSQILTTKYDCLKQAFTSMALSILPWLVAIALFVTHHVPTTAQK